MQTPAKVFEFEVVRQLTNRLQPASQAVVTAFELLGFFDYFLQPTIFADVSNDMTIAQEEIFGPVLCVISYDTLEEAVAIANDTPYGLAAYVSGPPDQARSLARRLRAGMVNLNRPEWDTFAPFGGYKQSGNGREYADWGIHDFCEVKAIVGHGK